MTYTVHYWRANLVAHTGLEQGGEIDDTELMTLITEQKVNVMIHHVAAKGESPARSYCYIDDLNHRFQQR